MRLAIVGSRCLAGHELAWQIIEHELERLLPRIHVVISGGARGVDSMAASAARGLGIKVVEHLPQVPADRAASWEHYKARDLLIAQDCTHLIAIIGLCSKTHGAQWTREQAEKLGKPTKEYVLS